MPEFPTLAHYDATMSRLREQIAELALHVDQLEDRWERRMTDVTSALSDLSAAEISVANELTALVAQVQTLQQQIASGDTTSAAATAASIESVVDHLLHIIDVAGEDVPALGSDFDGFVVPPLGLEDIAALPNLTVALANRGVSVRVLGKILGGNVMRVLDSVPAWGRL